MLRRKFLSMLANLPLIAIPVAATAEIRPDGFFGSIAPKREGVPMLFDPQPIGVGNIEIYEWDKHSRVTAQELLSLEEKEDLPYKIRRDLTRRRIAAKRHARRMRDGLPVVY